jgi:hypothetical protein
VTSGKERQQPLSEQLWDFLGDPVPAGHNVAGDVLGVGLRLVGHELSEGARAAKCQDRHGQRDFAVADGVGDVTVECLEVLKRRAQVSRPTKVLGVFSDGRRPSDRAPPRDLQ